MVHKRFGGAACTSFTALTVFGALALTELPSAAAVEPLAPSSVRTLGADSPPPVVLHAMERDLGLTGAQARARLVNEAEAGTRAGKLQIALGKRFAGAWVQGATSAQLTVATTEAADVPAITAGGAKAVVVKNTLEDLKAAKAKVDASAGRDMDTPVRYVDVRTNRVTVQATNRGAARRLVALAGVNRRLVQVKVSADRPRALHDVRGGDAYHIDEKFRCSVGFSVTKGEQQGFASAGHCGKEGAKTTGFNKVAQGSVAASIFPGKDMSWVSVNSDWTATPAVKGEGDQDVKVTGSVEALVGAAICRSGSTSGWHCGKIEQHGSSVTYAEGVVDGVTRTTACAERGDSGGSFLSGTQAQGMTSGGSGDCTSGGVTFYQPVNPLLSEFGLALKTDAGASTPGVQERPSGGWSMGKVYGTGVRVVHNGVAYECLQSHQAQGVWQPDRTPALWQRV
ncbi:alpha-lytic protease prodomain-containing protein [Streptomyces sp. NPDC058657]|uniref:alpha-lytic protease prodomain-containing protein n=1 Tax=unclassified Streptomyces TaxID=2593676 RepID=UPI003654AE86